MIIPLWSSHANSFTAGPTKLVLSFCLLSSSLCACRPSVARMFCMWQSLHFHSCVRAQTCLCVCVRGDPCRKGWEGGGTYLHWQLHKGKWTDFKAGVQLNCKASERGSPPRMSWQTGSHNTDRHSQGLLTAAHWLHSHVYSTALLTVYGMAGGCVCVCMWAQYQPWKS